MGDRDCNFYNKMLNKLKLKKLRLVIIIFTIGGISIVGLGPRGHAYVIHYSRVYASMYVHRRSWGGDRGPPFLPNHNTCNDKFVTLVGFHLDFRP